MSKKEDKDTRYFIDLDMKTQKILGWDFGHRHDLTQVLTKPNHHRIFITKGQYNKLVKTIESIK